MTCFKSGNMGKQIKNNEKRNVISSCCALKIPSHSEMASQFKLIKMTILQFILGLRYCNDSVKHGDIIPEHNCVDPDQTGLREQLIRSCLLAISAASLALYQLFGAKSAKLQTTKFTSANPKIFHLSDIVNSKI